MKKILLFWTAIIFLFILCLSQASHAEEATVTFPAKLTGDQLYEQGLSLCNQEKYAEAIVPLEEAIKRKTNFAEAYYQIGVCYLKIKESDQAKKNLTLANVLTQSKEIKDKSGFLISQITRESEWHELQKPPEKEKQEEGGGVLWWSLKDTANITFIYGEVEVLASGPTIYYCGAGWRGGYSGIQEQTLIKRNVIFSVWDTYYTYHSTNYTGPSFSTREYRHPSVVHANKRTVHNRFTNEGEGEHTHLDYNWGETKVFKFAVIKQPDKSGSNILTTFYYYDKGWSCWVLEATISNPIDTSGSHNPTLSRPTEQRDAIRYFSGIYSFLENWTGTKKREIPKLCLYRLWVGTTSENLKFLREADGKGYWGILNNSYYLAEGAGKTVDAIIAQVQQPQSADSLIRTNGINALIPDRILPPETIGELQKLPGPTQRQWGPGEEDETPKGEEIPPGWDDDPLMAILQIPDNPPKGTREILNIQHPDALCYLPSSPPKGGQRSKFLTLAAGTFSSPTIRYPSFCRLVRQALRSAS